MRNFKELLIWQRGMEIWEESYKITQLLPADERFGLVSQINRASASIPANIAEGASRKGVKDQARFIQIALGSTFELETFYIGMTRLKLAEEAEINRILELIIEEQKMLSGYLKQLTS
ncbi:MAG: four helix bundle protein [Ekhidna sp.]|uniref:four helix bundle protein n=1 Tax=Ekhidna sp. TaxID=2608089 RepID=UPI0032EE0B63